MSYFLYLLGIITGAICVHIYYYFKDDYKQGYLDGFKRGKGLEN